MAKTRDKRYRDEASKVRIESRRAEMCNLFLRGYSQTEVSHKLGISQAHVCRELQEVVREWQQESVGAIDQRRETEYRRALSVLSQCFEEFELSRKRLVYPTIKSGENKGKPDLSKAPKEVRVEANPEWMTHIRGLLELICKIRGVFSDTTVTSTTNNLNVFSMEKLVAEIKGAQDSPERKRLEEVERLQEVMENGAAAAPPPPEESS